MGLHCEPVATSSEDTQRQTRHFSRRDEAKENRMYLQPSRLPPGLTFFNRISFIHTHFIDSKWLKYMASSLSFFSICSRQASEGEIILKI